MMVSRLMALFLVCGLATSAVAQEETVPLPPPRPSINSAPIELGSAGGGSGETLQPPPPRPAIVETAPLASPTDILNPVKPPPGVTLKTPAVAGSAKPPPQTQQEALARVNAYLNAIKVMSGTFTQVSADGAQATGKFYILKPGRLRFQYDPPSSIELISDGRSVAVRDRKLNTQDLYFLSQTPLRFLLEDKIDLATDAAVIGVSVEDGYVSVRLEEKNAIGGTARIVLVFSAADDTLQRWTVIDPQGFETAVTLASVDTKATPPDKLFVINDQPLRN